jgi:hypothetical protein
MHIDTLNWFAIFAAAISTFVLGGIWYSPMLFGKAWMNACGFTKESLDGGNTGKIFGLSFIFSVVMAFNLAMFLNDPKTNASWGATAGFLAGFGWVALSIAIIALFERRSWKYMLINGGYMTVAFVLMGWIIGAWRK